MNSETPHSHRGLKYTWRVFKHLTAPLGDKRTKPESDGIIQLIRGYENAIEEIRSRDLNLPPWYKDRVGTMLRCILHPDFREDLQALQKCSEDSLQEYRSRIEDYFIQSYGVRKDIARQFTDFVCSGDYHKLNMFNSPVRKYLPGSVVDTNFTGTRLLLEIDEGSTIDDIEWFLRNEGGLFVRRKSKAQFLVRDMVIYILRMQNLGPTEIDRLLTEKYEIKVARDDVLSFTAINKVVERLKPKSGAMGQLKLQILDEKISISKSDRILGFDTENSHFTIKYDIKRDK